MNKKQVYVGNKFNLRFIRGVPKGGNKDRLILLAQRGMKEGGQDKGTQLEHTSAGGRLQLSYITCKRVLTPTKQVLFEIS